MWLEVAEALRSISLHRFRQLEETKLFCQKPLCLLAMWEKLAMKKKYKK